MRILGIESSSLVAGVAILEDESIIAEYNVNYKKVGRAPRIGCATRLRDRKSVV